MGAYGLPRPSSNVRAVEVKLRGPFSLRALLPSYRSNAAGRPESHHQIVLHMAETVPLMVLTIAVMVRPVMT